MRILLAGAAGQLGAAVVELAPELGIEPVPLIRRRRPGRMPFERVHPELAAAVVHGDVCEPNWGLAESDLDALAGSVDAVVNLAADTNWAAGARELYRVNVLGAVHGLDVTTELMRRSGRRMLYCHASSFAVAGGALGRIAEAPLPPDRHRTEYEDSKWNAEQELFARHLPGGPDVLVARVSGLLGDSATGRTEKRNSLYMLADQWGRLPGRALPAMAGARVDALPRDMAARTLLGALQGMARTEQPGGPVVVHVCAGEDAPPLRALLETARGLSPATFDTWVRLVPATAEQVLWTSANGQRFLPLDEGWRNLFIGLRYLGLDRCWERGRLAALVDGPLPAPDLELLARLTFGLPAPQRPRRPADPGLSRFLP